MSNLKLAFALHDVTPFHRQRIERAEACFARWGIEKATYLFIPDYHARHAAASPEFAAWCRRERPFAVDWFLHGYYHRECSAPRPPREIRSAAEIRCGESEAEFAALDDDATEARLTDGRKVFEDCLGFAPRGFVAPRWAFRPTLLSKLTAHRFEWTESYRNIVHLPSDRQFSAPVLTWATRTVVRKWTSILGIPALSLLHSRTPLLRIAVHPFDFDHPRTICSIERAVRSALHTRQQVVYDELLGS